MIPLILRLDSGGRPISWMSWHAAVVLYVSDKVSWTLGERVWRIYGGQNRISGARSYVDIHSIIACKGVMKAKPHQYGPPLTNRELFRRDHHICMYCLEKFPESWLTRDHVIPLCKRGRDVWGNVVTACFRCNQKKNGRTPEEANMMLHAIPYAPCHAEWLVLRNRRIQADQMEFLQGQYRKRNHLKF